MKSVLLKYALAVVAVLATLQPQFTTCHAQGSLVPSGPPAPSMKSLDQIEPRTIVNAVNTPGDAGDMFIISKPGSYYLTTNITTTSIIGINIQTSNVTLDLGGFAVQGPGPVSASATVGIYIANAQTNVTVRNGALSGWNGPGSSAGVGVGVYAANALSENLLFEHLNISGSGDGIFLYGPGVIRDCTVTKNIGDGINCGYFTFSASLVTGCTVSESGAAGITISAGTVSACVANQNELDGIDSSYGSVSDCTAVGNGGDGINAGPGNVSGCSATENDTDGIYDNSGTVSSCSAFGNGAEGIDMIGGTVSACTSFGNSDSGIYGAQTTVVGCTANQNGNNGVELDFASPSTLPGTVSGCVVQLNNQNGIFINGTGGLVTGNNCTSNNVANISGCAGITIYYSSGNRVEDNHVSGTGLAGILVSGSNNLIIKNSVFGNSGNDYGISGTQIVGPIITATGTISSTSPWANFAF